MTATKRCAKCNTVKPLTEFHRRRKCRDGRQNKCKQCASRAARHRYEQNGDVIRLQCKTYRHGLGEVAHVRARERHRKDVEKRSEYFAEYRRSNKGKRRASAAVQTALRNGTLARPDICSRCRTTERRLVAHHHSYEQSSWLDVEWICDRCHMEEHAA